MWPRLDLQVMKEAAVNGLYGLGHMWSNLRTHWQQGLDIRTLYSGIGTVESGCDLVEQDSGTTLYLWFNTCYITFPNYDWYDIDVSRKDGRGSMC